MRFACSLEMVDVYSQQPNRNVRECKFYWDELFELIAAAGFAGVEQPYELKWSFGGRSGIPLSRYSLETKFGSAAAYLEDLKSRGIEKVTGLHFDPMLFAGDPADAYFGAYENFAAETIGLAGELGCDSVSLSPMWAIGEMGDKIADEAAFLDRTAEMITRLADVAEKAGVRLCVKNEYWTLLRGEKIHEFMKKLPESVYYAVDTANLLIAGVDPAAFVKACAGRIGAVQFTDTAFVDDVEAWKQPMPEYPVGKPTQVFRDLGQGDVDFKGVYDALNEAGYDGWIVVNNRQTRDVSRGLLRARYHIDNAIVRE